MLADTLTIALFNLHVLEHDDFASPPLVAAPGVASADAPETVALHDPLGAMTSPGLVPDVSDPAVEQVDVPPLEHSPGKRPVLLRKEAFKRVLTLFAKKMETEFHHPAAQRQMSYTDALVFQARQYRRFVEGEADGYQPLTLR